MEEDGDEEEEEDVLPELEKIISRKVTWFSASRAPWRVVFPNMCEKNMRASTFFATVCCTVLLLFYYYYYYYYC